MGVVEFVFAQAIAHAGKVVEFNVWLVFELLHEVAVPAQPPGKAAQGVGKRAVRRVGNRHLGGLVHRAHGQRAKGQVRAQAAAAFFGTQAGWRALCGSRSRALAESF